MIHMQNLNYSMLPRTGTKITHIPYKSAVAKSTNARCSLGLSTFQVTTTADALPQIAAGKLRALAVTSDLRLPKLPDVPTVKEIFPNYGDATVWQGVFVRVQERRVRSSTN